METEKRTIVEQRLKAPFLDHEYSIRPGSFVGNDKAQPLVYIDPRTVSYRLTKVFGVGGWGTEVSHLDCTHEELYKFMEFSQLTDVMKQAAPFHPHDSKDYKKNPKGMFVPLKTGLHIGMAVTIWVNRPDLGFDNVRMTNVGESSADDTQDIGYTIAWAQAFKRSATLMGIGEFLYCMELPPAEVSYGKFKSKITIPDASMDKALKASGFVFKCEATGAKIPWQEAAYSVYLHGQVLCKAKAKELSGQASEAG
jgi:hypothetical protein